MGGQADIGAGAPTSSPGTSDPPGGYWPSVWPAEDGGPRRVQAAPVPPGGRGLGRDGRLQATARDASLATMVVTRDPGEVFVLLHTAGDHATATVERVDPVTLAPLASSVELRGGPTWPGSIAAHANGSLVVVFGNHAHRLAADLEVLAATELPRGAPYNGIVVLPDGSIVTKDFAGSRPGHPVPAAGREPCELVVLEPDGLRVVDACAMPEPSIARLSADGDTVYVVGDTSLMRARWDGRALRPDPDFRVRYRTRDGQGYGWDCVIAGGGAWFLDDGEGSEAYDGSLRGHGVATAPLQLVRVDLVTGALDAAEVSGLPGGLVANPPVVDTSRGVAVGYDTGNGVVRGFTVEPGGAGGGVRLTPRWRREQDHGSHLLLGIGGELLTTDYDPARAMEQAVVLDISTGEELARCDTGSPVQSVLFPAAGFDGDAYLCSFTTLTRLHR